LRPLMPPAVGAGAGETAAGEEASLEGLREVADWETGERERLGVVGWRAAEGRMRWPRISISVKPEAWPFSRLILDSFSAPPCA